MSNILRPEDTCFTFGCFPLEASLIEEEKNHRIEITDGIYLIRTPKEKIINEKSPKDIIITERLLPGYYQNQGVCHTSIKIDSPISPGERDKSFWATILAFYLVKPNKIHVGGKFTCSENENFVKDAGSFDMRTNLSLSIPQFRAQETWLTYDSQDIEIVKHIQPKIYHYSKPENNPRMSSILQGFAQAAIFEKLFYASSIYQKLFPVLDGLTGNPTNGSYTKMSARLGNFLAEVPLKYENKVVSSEEVTKASADIWSFHRYPELHGHLKMEMLDVNNTTLFSDEQNIKDLLTLAELIRIALLKILLLSDKNLLTYSAIPIPPTGLSKSSANSFNKKRDKAANDFFDRQYVNPNALRFFSDLIHTKPEH